MIINLKVINGFKLFLLNYIKKHVLFDSITQSLIIFSIILYKP